MVQNFIGILFIVLAILVFVDNYRYINTPNLIIADIRYNPRAFIWKKIFGEKQTIRFFKKHLKKILILRWILAIIFLIVGISSFFT